MDKEFSLIPSPLMPNYVEWQTNAYRTYEYTDCLSVEQLLQARTMGIALHGEDRYMKASSVIENLLDHYYTKPVSSSTPDLEAFLGSVIGLMIEIGGPTEQYDFPLMPVEAVKQKSGKPITIFNKMPFPGVEVLADANKLPFENDAVGLIMASCLPNYAREHFFKEAYRTLRPKGILAYQRCSDLDVFHSLGLGFKMEAYSRLPRPKEEFASGQRAWNIILSKPIITETL